MRGSSLCWLCQHATNKYRACPWSAKLKPVPGWTVKENPKTGGGLGRILPSVASGSGDF